MRLLHHQAIYFLRIQRIVLILLVAWAFLGRALAAQEPAIGAIERQPNGNTVFDDTVDVRVINLEAVVTDRQGNRVHGLAAGDFRLLVDGEETPIGFFTEVREGVAVPRNNEVEAIGIPAAAEPGTPVGTSFLVFIDDLLSVGAQRNTAIEGLITGLDQLGPADRMAVVAYDGLLETLTPWTRSRSKLAKVLEQAKQRRSFGLHHIASQINFGRGNRVMAGLDSRGQQLTGGTDPTADRGADNKQISNLARLSDAVTTALSGAPPTAGRRVLVLLAGGWPTDLYSDSNDAYFGAPAELGLTQPIIETANLTGYTIYPVGLVVPSAGRIGDRPIERTSISGPVGRRAGGGSAGPGAVLGREQSSTFSAADHSTLRVLAAATGGRPLLYGKRRHALDAVAEDARSYYWLGFTPTIHGNGYRHRLEIEVRRPGLKVRNRGAYRDLSRARELDMGVQSALLFGTESQATGLRITLGKPEFEQITRMAVPIEVGIAARDLTFLPSREGVAAEAELRFGAQEADGHHSTIATIPLRLTSEQIPADDHIFFYKSKVRLRRQHLDLVVSLVDHATGRTVTETVSISPTGDPTRR